MDTQATLAAAGIDWAAAKEGLKRLLPLLELIARNTPNQYDDAAVTLLRMILQEKVSVG